MRAATREDGKHSLAGFCFAVERTGDSFPRRMYRFRVNVSLSPLFVVRISSRNYVSDAGNFRLQLISNRNNFVILFGIANYF